MEEPEMWKETGVPKGTWRLREGHFEQINRKQVKSPTYTSWFNMIQRCTYSSYVKWHLYGGAGIQVSRRWLDFDNFIQDMGVRPAGMTLDRVDATKGYYKDNCQWATCHTQISAIQHKNSKTGYAGVCINKNQFSSEIRTCGRDYYVFHYLGNYKTKEEAAYARDLAHIGFGGDPRGLNFPNRLEQYESEVEELKTRGFRFSRTIKMEPEERAGVYEIVSRRVLDIVARPEVGLHYREWAEDGAEDGHI